MTLDEWLRSHRYLEPVATLRRRIDAAIDAATRPLPVPSDWDEYAEDFTAGVPLLRSQMPIDLEPGGHAVVTVVHTLASDAVHTSFTEDAAAQDVQLQQTPLAPRCVVDCLLGDESWGPVRSGLLRSVGWITFSAALHPLVQAFAQWRIDDRWLRRYCPTCGALPAMAQFVGTEPRRRFLSCGCCGTRWRYGRTMCPFCEADKQRLSAMTVEGEGGLRIDHCESCGGYLKTYVGEGSESVLLADWTSLHLDVVAIDRGLTRQAASLYDLEAVLAG